MAIAFAAVASSVVGCVGGRQNWRLEPLEPADDLDQSLFELSKPVPVTAPIAEHLGLRFVGRECDPDRTQEHCNTRMPKTWTQEEIEIVKSALNEIDATPRGRAVIQRAQALGYGRLRRFAHHINLPSGTANTSARAVLRRVTRTIDFNDAFFRCISARDKFSGTPGLSITTMVTLHEIMHAVDDARIYSESAEFLRLLDFRRDQHGVWRLWRLNSLSQVDAQEWDRQVRRSNDAADAGLCELSFAISREYGPKLLKTLPSMRAADRPSDAFAEIGMHLVLDRQVESYLQPNVVEYFNTHVFVQP